MSSQPYGLVDPMPNAPAPDRDRWDPSEDNGKDARDAKLRRYQEKKYKAYKKVFGSAEGRFVLKDLMAVSYYHGIIQDRESPAVLGEFELGRREGRRELYFLILNHARATFDEIDKIKRVEMK